MGGRRRNGGTSVSAANGSQEASETLSGSFAQRHHARMLATAESESCVGADAAVANLQREQCLSMGGRRRKSSAPVSGPRVVLATYGTLSRSLLVYHHDQMQANAVSQSAARCWSRGRRLLLSDAVLAHASRRNGGAPVSGTSGVFAACGALSRSLAMYHHAWLHANAVSQRAAWVLVPRSLIYSASNAYRWAGGAENAAHLFWRQLGCLQRMGH